MKGQLYRDKRFFHLVYDLRTASSNEETIRQDFLVILKHSQCGKVNDYLNIKECLKIRERLGFEQKNNQEWKTLLTDIVRCKRILIICFIHAIINHKVQHRIATTFY